jgi:hypothetical protein
MVLLPFLNICRLGQAISSKINCFSCPKLRIVNGGSITTFGWGGKKFRPTESCMHEVINEVYLQIFSHMSANFMRQI